MKPLTTLPILLVLPVLLACAGVRPGASDPADRTGASATTSPEPAANYWVYVGSESADLIHRIRLGPGGAEVEQTTEVGELAVEIEGPHGLAVSPDGDHLYMTTAHGIPDGKFWKLELGTGRVVAEPILLGHFPASLDLTPDGLYAFVVNFNLHGDMVPSSVSVVYTPSMTEVVQIETCTMPHGSRISGDGSLHYSTCMMDDQLVEIDTRTFRVSRRFGVATGEEGAVELKAAADVAAHPGHEPHPGHDPGAAPDPARAPDTGPGPGRHPHPSCSPTWAHPSPDGSRVYVACNRSDVVLEIDAGEWTLLRRFPTGRGPYNVDVTADGRVLVATLKQGAGVEFIDLTTGETVARRESSTTVTHGIALSPDSRYAFVSVEGVGAEPGKVDIFDLRSFERVASVDVGQQAGGISFWKMEAAR